MITAIIDAGQHYCQAVSDLWQWDYGQTLRIQGVKLPAAVEIQFSTTERIGETVTRIGVTQEGVTEVPIPDTLLEGGGTTQDYTIYAFVYIENGDSGKTEYRVSMKVRARPKPEAHATPEEGELFRQAIATVSESADRAESARKSAETAADQAEDAKNAAESASGSAQASADEAKTSKENAETAVKNAEAFKTETETAKAEAVQAAEDVMAAKKSAEEARAAAEKAKQDAETAKAAADADKEAAETARSEAETAKNDAVQAKDAAEKAKIGTAADRETAETASKAARISAMSAEESAKKAEAAKEEIQESADQIQKNATEIDSLKENLSNIISPNLFNPEAAKANVAISSNDGSEMNGFSGWETTDYIPVSKGEVLYFSSNNEPTAYSTGAFYDVQKKFISGFGNHNRNNNITVESDGYARFSFGSKKEKLQIEKGSRTTYIPYGEVKVKAEVDHVRDDTANIKAEVSEVKAKVVKIQEDHTNLFNKDAVVKGAVLPDSGYFDASFSSWETSDYIPVKPGMVLYFSSNELPIGVASTGAYFDKDKKYLSPLKDKPLSITIPDGAYFIRFSKNGGFGDTLNTLKIEQHGITKFTPYGELYVTVNESALPSSILPKWKGLKILTLGDSITAMGGVNGWTYWIKQYLLTDKVVNVSVTGSTWQDKVVNQTYDGNPQPSTDGNVMGNQVQKVLNAKANGDADYQDFDVITFSFGTNDSIDFSVQTKESVESQFITNYAQNNFTVVPIDNVNRQTLTGAMRYGFQKLHEAYPNAVIFMCTPTQECYENFDSIYKKGDFINFVADRLGAETIDTRRCGIRNIYESQTTIDYDHPEQSGVAPIQTDLLDGIHTNENGAKKIAKYNAREIMKYFMIN